MSKKLYRIRKEARRYLATLIRFIYPASCIFCTKSLGFNERYSCFACLHSFPQLRQPLCEKCGIEIPRFGRFARCSPCRNQKTFYDRGAAHFRYDDKIKTLLQSVKFSKKSWYLKTLKRTVSTIKLPLTLSEYDIIVPVPLDKSRLRTREFNQSELIARMIGNLKNAPKVVPVLQKIKHTKPQSSLHQKERLENLTAAFRVKKSADVSDKKILVVDDIVTTGATMNECARSLKQAGAKRVDFFSLARTTHLMN